MLMQKMLMLCWLGHDVQIMEDGRILKDMRARRARFKDVFKRVLQATKIPTNSREDFAEILQKWIFGTRRGKKTEEI